MTTPGNFARTFMNGIEITPDHTQSSYGHVYGANAVMPQNVGVKQYAPAAFNPSYSLSGYERHGMGSYTAHNLLFPSGVGNANDVEYIISELLGNNAAPAQGDCAVLYDGTLVDYKRPTKYTDQLTWNATFRPRGKRMPPFPILLYDNSAIKTATNISSTPYDDGAESTSTSQGAVGVLQVYSPTGVAATGTISLTGTPSDGDNFVLTIGGVVYTFTFKTALTPTAGQVLINGTAGSAANLFAAMTGGAGSGTNYAAGTTQIPQFPLSSALVAVSVPSATNVINLTAVNTGTAANAYTLVKTGVNLAVSGATLTGGVAGDTYNITLASSATSGGSYTTHITWSGVGAVRQALRTEVAIGTAILEWLKVTITLATGAGTAQTFAGNICFGRYFQG